MCKKFIEETRKVLNVEKTDDRYDRNGFRVFGEKQKGILVLGMNPAGDHEHAENEEDKKYLYYIPDCDTIENRTYPKYFKPIFEAFKEATDEQIKWDWCNVEVEDLFTDEDDDKAILEKYDAIIRNHHNEYKDKTFSLYIGDLFYYHMTDQTTFRKLVDGKQKKQYLRKMLQMHIAEIENKGNTVELIYINNATASRWLFEALDLVDQYHGYPSFVDYEPTFVDYEPKKDVYNGGEHEFKKENYRIFFGGMLSGQRAMDVFSRQRLIMEMKTYLKTSK